jgi:hypothetical protein
MDVAVNYSISLLKRSDLLMVGSGCSLITLKSFGEKINILAR